MRKSGNTSGPVAKLLIKTSPRNKQGLVRGALLFLQFEPLEQQPVKNHDNGYNRQGVEYIGMLEKIPWNS